MTTMKSSVAGVRPWILAISLALATGALAQTGDAAASQADMRLWSFGDCERKFPRADTEEYKECMRVVGSTEAKDLRAQRLCEDSYANDHAGIDRCLSAYRATKEGRAPASMVSDAPASATATLSPEMTLQVKAIASAAVEQNSTAARQPVPAEAAPAREGSSVASLVLVGALAILLLGVGGTFVLRRQV